MTGPPSLQGYGLYVHVPWCRARCPYCAFAITPAAHRPDPTRYLAAVLREWQGRAQVFAGSPRSVFFGGGTPSRLAPSAFTALLSAFAPHPGAEVTIEVNPEDLDEAWLEGVLAAGVTRVSLGLQTTREPIARRLGRGHTHADGLRALELLSRSAVPSFSVDLIFAVPGQTLADLDADIDHVLAAGAPHISVYGLTIEAGTGFGRAAARGSLVPTDDDLWRDLYDQLVARLEGAGRLRYEVSNFALEGHTSVHNRGYWSDLPYLGLGPSAHSYAPDGQRWVNRADLAQYLVARDPIEHREHPGGVARATDRLVSGLRAIDGVDLDVLATTCGVRPEPRTVARCIEHGLLVQDGARIRLTTAGFPVCDAVVTKLVDTLGR